MRHGELSLKVFAVKPRSDYHDDKGVLSPRLTTHVEERAISPRLCEDPRPEVIARTGVFRCAKRKEIDMVGVMLVVGTCLVIVVLAYVFVGKDRSLQILSRLVDATFSLIKFVIADIQRRSQERAEALKAKSQKGALLNKKREPSLFLDVNEQIARMTAGVDDELAVLEDAKPAKKTRSRQSDRETVHRNYDVAVVGTSHSQSTLERICGGRTPKSANKQVKAVLHLENDNEYDRQAVRVDIEDQHVGYLDRDDARRFRRELKKAGMATPLGVSALIVGGWDKGPDDRGHFGVRLELFEH